MPARQLLAAVLLFTASARAGSVTAHGRAGAAPDRCVVQFYLRQEINPDVSTPAEKSLDHAWKQARQWLLNTGVAEADIHALPPASRQFNDQKKYLVQRVAVVQKLEPGVTTDPVKAEEVLQRLARLIDQAASRGLFPAAQLSQLVTDAAEVNDSSAAPQLDFTNHFVFYLPAHPQSLVAAALKDAARNLRMEMDRLARVEQPGGARPISPRVHDVISNEEAASHPTDLPAGRIGLGSQVFAEVTAYAVFTADLDLTPGKPDLGAQTVTITATGRVPAPAERATLYTRLVAPEASFQKSISRLSELTGQIEAKVRKANPTTAPAGPVLRREGVALFCGYPGTNVFGMIGMNANADGQPPAGAYRDVRITFEKAREEDEPAFRRRVAEFAGSLDSVAGNVNPNPNPNANNPNVPPPVESAERTHELVFSPADFAAYRAKALNTAMAEARASARRTLDALGGKLGAIDEIDLTDDPAAFSHDDPYAPNNPAGDSERQRHGEHPELSVTVTVRFRAEIP